MNTINLLDITGNMMKECDSVKKEPFNFAVFLLD